MVSLLNFRRCFGLILGLAALGAVRAEASDSTYVRFNTSLGNIDVQMLSDEAPLNVANFMGYVNSNAYNNSIIHRSIPGFVIQGGGFTVSNGNPSAIPAGAPVAGEHDPVNNPTAFSNVRGTLALALSTGPNSGTNEWFFNLASNTALDTGDGGPFTVFGTVANASSLAVMDAIAAEPTYDASSYFASLYGTNFPSGAFTNLPLINFVSTPLATSNFVVITSVVQYTPFSGWQLAFKSDPNAATDDLQNATPQKDTIPNLVKYVCGIAANQTMTANDRAKLPTATSTTSNGQTNLTLTWHQRPNLNVAGVTVTAQTSTDMASWSTVAATKTGTDSDGDDKMQAQVPAPATGTQFIRLSVTQ